MSPCYSLGCELNLKPSDVSHTNREVATRQLEMGKENLLSKVQTMESKLEGLTYNVKASI